ncbi:type VI secretion protein VgrG [Candidatus Magnetomorum sp. HK-1]|nr:type VI secretion protein VgrG [Candidatus Magnetomorum sp. HK-1]
MPTNKNQYNFTFTSNNENFHVVDFKATEGISLPYEVNLSIASEYEIIMDTYLDKEGVLIVESNESRFFHGIICQFAYSGFSESMFVYSIKLVPTIWLLSYKIDCRIFQNLTPLDIVTQILEETGIFSDRFDIRVQKQCDVRDYCVQYNETTLNFISRLLEEEGIFYFFEHFEDYHLMVIGDSPVAYLPVHGLPEIEFKNKSGQVTNSEFVFDLKSTQRIFSGKALVNAYNPEQPDLNLQQSSQKDTFDHLEIYHYSNAINSNTTQKIATNVINECAASKEIVEAQSICPRILPGFTIRIFNHPLESMNQELLIIKTIHTGSQPQLMNKKGGGIEGSRYSNSFYGTPSNTQYLPERSAKKPCMNGIHTAIVVGPDGEDIYTDKLGRVKIQFHWDRNGSRDEFSSCWIRVSQNWAGKNTGMFFLPRVGQEVIVSFVDGNPDNPLIVGSVHNAQMPPPYSLPEDRYISTIRSGTSEKANEISLNDTPDNEQIYVHAVNNLDTQVKSDIKEEIGNNKHVLVQNSVFQKVVNNKNIIIDGEANEKIGDTLSRTIGHDKHEVIGNNAFIDTEKNFFLNAGKDVVISAEKSITLRVGSTFVVIGPSGVDISGQPIRLNSGGNPSQAIKANPEFPEEAETISVESENEVQKMDMLKPSKPCTQGKLLAMAAKSGVPFCEVCQ